MLIVIKKSGLYLSFGSLLEDSGRARRRAGAGQAQGRRRAGAGRGAGRGAGQARGEAQGGLPFHNIAIFICFFLWLRRF